MPLVALVTTTDTVIAAAAGDRAAEAAVRSEDKMINPDASE